MKRAGASRHRQQTTVICVGGVCPRRATAAASPEQQAEEGNTTAAVAVALSGRSVGLISNMRERERVIGGGAVGGEGVG